jgi:N-acetyl-anhydromuramyl-L-alanine amidase AmpD
MEAQPTKVTSDGTLKIFDRLMSAGFKKSTGRTIDTIIIHSSYDALGGDPFNVAGIIKEYKDYGVSAHYIIGRDGTIYRLVREQDIAYHAGVSKVPDGRMNVNDFSIGIEVVTTKTSAPTVEQYAALQKLVDAIKIRNKIKYVLGHDQIAPGRKDDPWNFDWKKLN